MANKRTVDPTAEFASSRVVGIRVTTRQIEQLSELAQANSCSRSTLIRRLIQMAYDAHKQPEPF